MKKWIITQKEQNFSLIKFLKNCLESHSQKKIKQLIHNNGCLVNGKVERFASTRLKIGDSVVLREIELSDVKIVFEDGWIRVYEKPSKLSCEKLNYKDVPLVHRLDRDTSGLLVVAKDLSSYQNLVDQFKNRTVKKEYLALVDQPVQQNQGMLKNYLDLKKVYDGQKIYGVASSGKLAITEWTLLKRFQQASLVLCKPKTGRTHQIRVHMLHLGHPILGDYQYCHRFKSKYRPLRHLLHASFLSFKHPKTQSLLQFKAELPKDFEKAINELDDGPL